MKIYECCICHEKLQEKPIRLVKQEYAYNKYNQYEQVEKYDICKKCYTLFDNWIKKYNKNKKIN